MSVGMELKDFIQETLKEISAGVKGANSGIDGCTDTPYCLYHTMGDNAKKHKGIDFDIAVTLSDKGETSGGAKISVAQVFGVGVKANTESSDVYAHRIKFSIGVNEDIK
ncbi:MAG TPA: hypothetical protein DD400_02705 [Rhodospirillaceae bacterium]|nr:hypothetical protein [Rhodospirillaceae bacterium]